MTKRPGILSSSGNHPDEKSLSPLPNGLVDESLIRLIPFIHNAFSSLVHVRDFSLVHPDPFDHRVAVNQNTCEVLTTDTHPDR